MDIFKTQLDYELSPFTGLTRQHWLEAATYLMEGVFNNIDSFDAPVVMPRKETKITYPHGDNIREKKAEYFEGLARSMFIAAPLIHENPDIEINGISLREYYKSHILRSCSPEDEQGVGTYEQMLNTVENYDPTICFQQTVETCALVICLWITRTEIWETYTKEEQDLIADFLFGYANGNTVPQNWRLFNMLDLAFLYKMGYEIDADIMREHARGILEYYTSDGWYRDGHSFDYYSCWAFQVYGPIWCDWYGYEKEPFLAKEFEKNSNELMKTYDRMFDEDGFTNMWGRSNIYRNAATSSFEGNFNLKNPTANPGLSRRIASGSLLQFITRDDFLHEGIPTLGFYGQFMPLVQSYSCAESPFWLGKAFLCLTLPADHPFWSAKEENGVWSKLKDKEVLETELKGPGIVVSNHKANGQTIFRTGKVLKQPNDRHGMWNYSKLCFNSKYPWEAGADDDIEAQEYVLYDPDKDKLLYGNALFYVGVKNQVLYRHQYFDYCLERECHWTHGINLADFSVPYGVIRVDRLKLYKKPMELTLGAYGFPDNGTTIIKKESLTGDLKSSAIILKGFDHCGRKKQLAMTIIDGFAGIDVVKRTGTNPDSENSIVVYARTNRNNQNHYEKSVLISQVITKESHEDFTEDELFPVKQIYYSDTEGFGGYGPIELILKDGNKKNIDFNGIEGNLCL